mgnify:CR=1 FL=1
MKGSGDGIRMDLALPQVDLGLAEGVAQLAQPGDGLVHLIDLRVRHRARARVTHAEQHELGAIDPHKLAARDHDLAASVQGIDVAKAKAIAAGLAGGTVRTLFDSRFKPLVTILSAISGGLTANYLAQAFSAGFDLKDPESRSREDLRIGERIQRQRLGRFGAGGSPAG